MTRTELRDHCERQVKQFERVAEIMPVTPNDWKRYEEHKLILELLKQEADAMEFARWVVDEIFRGKVEEDSELFTELACRRSLKLGLVKVKNRNEWQIVGTPLDNMIEKLEESEEENDTHQRRDY